MSVRGTDKNVNPGARQREGACHFKESQFAFMSSPPILMSLIQAAPAGQAGGAVATLFQFFPILIIFVIFYFLIMRPQSVRAKQHQAEIAAVKKGDEVITGGGIRGRVTKVIEDEAEIEIAQGVKIRVIKSTLSQVLTPASKSAND